MKIILKKILSDNPRTYGDAIEFEFATITVQPTAFDTSLGELSVFKWTGENSWVGGTNLHDLNAVAGDRFQAFTLEDEMLGFIISYRGIASGNISDTYKNRRIWMIYNEEIGAYSLEVTTSRTDRVEKIGINYRYSGETLNEVLTKAETLYNFKFEPYTEGMNTNKWEIFQVAFYIPDSTTWQGSNLTKRDTLATKPKLRPFSSWYKLITGKFYKQEEMFALPLASGEKFYLGKVNSVTAENATITSGYKSNYTNEIANENSYGFPDVTYGTEMAHIVSQFKQAILFENGLRMYITGATNVGDSESHAYAVLEKLEAGTQLKMNMRFKCIKHFEGADGIAGVSNWALSRLQGVLSKVNFTGVLETYEPALTSIDWFMSPNYNGVEWKDFSNYLSTLELDENGWKKLLGRVITLGATYAIDCNTELKTAYGYTGTQNMGTFIISGFLKGSDLQAASCANWYRNDTSLVNNFVDAKTWSSVIDFVSPVPEPEPGPEPGPEPEPGEDVYKGPFSVKDIADLSIEEGAPLFGEYEKLDVFNFMKEYLEDFGSFDYDFMESRGFYYPVAQKPTAKETLDHWRKRSGFIIKKHAKELYHLWEIAQAEFDPIYNVEEHIEETTKKTGSDTLRDAIDSVHTTDSYGEKSETENIGAGKGTSITGDSTSTTTNTKAGFNSSDFQKNEQNSTNNTARTDSYSDEARTNKRTNAASTDNHVTDFREDVHEQTFDNTVTHYLDRKGNVGTMSSPELLDKAAASNDVFDFYDKLYDMVLKELAIYTEDGLDIFQRR